MDHSEAIFTVIHYSWRGRGGVGNIHSALSDLFLNDMTFCHMKKEVCFQGLRITFSKKAENVLVSE